MMKIVRAERLNTHLLISLAGASGSGKTFSALRLAAGLSDKRPLLIDTQAGRGLHYADLWDYDYLDLEPPFTPERHIEALETGIANGNEVVIVDDISQEYDGIGGLMEIADGQTNSRGQPLTGLGKWKEPKMRHKKMVNAFLQARTHLIFCARAEEKVKQVGQGRGSKIVPLGWMPIVEKRWQYDMTLALTMNPEVPGKVDLNLPHRVLDQHKVAVRAGQHIDENAGRALGAWARGDTLDTPQELWRSARQAANDGRESLREFAKGLSEDDRAKVRPIQSELNKTARDAERRMGSDLVDEEESPERPDGLTDEQNGWLDSYDGRDA